MPSIIAHSLCGEKALLTCDADQLRRMINRQKWAFIYGCQGPDFLFFYHALPIYDQKRAGQVSRLATQMHEKKVNEAFRYMLDWLRKDPHDILVAYVAGWLSHHALDVQVHPYVYWRTGTPERHGDQDHQRLEAQIERGLLDYLDIDMKDYLPFRQMKHRSEKNARIAEMISGMLDEVYDFEFSVRECEEALQQFYRLEKMLSDPSGRKRRLIGACERLMGVPGKATAL
ncbi:MAG: zinc dependent phospholipase C family protein, partial [Erysipelotrichaceae bacterium]|nr:zinc dependent phospholipase C family protein [Erysipelotrichaceae bacterium]